MTVHVDTDGPVTIVTIDRPEVANAIDRPTAQELADAFRDFDTDPASAVAVLTGAGGTFCAGADLKAMSEPGLARVSRVEPDGDGPVGPTRMLLGKPVIAAVEGHAVAGGLELAAWCDLRVAAVDAVFGVYCRRWGIPLMDGGTFRLTRLLGHSHALDLILTGRGVSGEEALRMGLANRIVAKGTALEHATGLAHEIARRPQAALRSDRLASYEQWSLSVDDAISTEYDHGMQTLGSGEIQGDSSTTRAVGGEAGQLLRDHRWNGYFTAQAGDASGGRHDRRVGPAQRDPPRGGSERGKGQPQRGCGGTDHQRAQRVAKRLTDRPFLDQAHRLETERGKGGVRAAKTRTQDHLGGLGEGVVERQAREHAEQQ